MEKPFLAEKVQSFINALETSGDKPLYEHTYQEARNILRQAQKEGKNFPNNAVDDVSVSLGNGREMPVKIIRPKNPMGRLPVIFYIHGGGWVMGDYQTHERLVNSLSEETGAAVVFPVYEPSPEAQFPQTTDDLYAVLEYMVENAAEYNFDTGNLIVAGDSVGGNMAIAMALMAKQNGNRPKIRFMLLLYPVTDASFETKSYHIFADGPWLTRKAMQWFWDAYAPEKRDRNNILACPLLAKPEDLQELPPALIITDENDVLRDEGEDFARKLSDAGVEAVCVRFNGTIHDFMMLDALKDSEQSRKAVQFAAAALKEAINAGNSGA